ncbi:hypothetical protein SBRCBS47491_006015 [Sporothrix bragantina]|uniref:Chromatin spt2 protein n=1 Tax=Sporothrix bragantina TaxID=671064 RepID=A0ABP0C3F2_9PEZI
MIGDLLAQISGEAGSKPPAPAPLPKRKANTDLPSNQAAKVPRTTTAAPAQSYEPASTKYCETLFNLPKLRLVFSPGGSNRPAPSSSVNRSNANGSTSGAPKSAPKKGSYLEIMERAKAAQSSMGQMGKIQHKPLEKVPVKRDRMMTKAEETSRAGVTKKGSGLPPLGSARPRAGMAGRPGMAQRPLPGSKTSAREDERTGPPKGSGSASLKSGGASSAARRRPGGAAPKEEEKRVKKAATATTGYQGTARPRPTSSSSATGPPGGLGRRSGDGRSGGSSSLHRSAPRMPFSNPRRSRYDDEDDEMDDFIEYDDDEEEAEVGGRYGGYGRRGRYDDYDEEDESDMEAGLSDIDDEEQRADRAARREDAEQEALERRLKAEKEERKRRLMASSRR